MTPRCRQGVKEVATLTLGRTTKTMVTAPLRWLRHALTLVISNPVIPREMKVRMRFARTFWLQGIYLLILIAITAIAYYAIFAVTPIQNPQELQMRLQAFYHTLLYSLVILIVLIAPALTAGAIAFERERRTLELLLLTPLRPMQILVGKLIASLAFLLLLLTLALPVLTVGILMGGATVGDLLATYALLVFSLLHLCAFALYCSACNRSSGLATFWAYVGAAVMLGATSWMAIAEITIAAGRVMGMAAPNQVIFPLASLHPFAAPAIRGLTTNLFGINIPCWLIGALFSLLLTRLWLTAAAAKLPAVYRTNFVGSLRRQALLLSVLAILTFDAFFHFAPFVGVRHSSAEVTEGLLVLLMLLASFVTPFVPWIATFGEHEGKPPADDGWFRPLRMFQPVASGALPFLLFWFLLMATVAAALFIWRMGVMPFWFPIVAGVAYCLVCLTFFWAIGRFWSALLRQLTLARWSTLITLLLVTLLPSTSEWSLHSPFFNLSPQNFAPFVERSVVCGIVVAFVTALLLLLSHTLGSARRRPQMG
ncbi:MAG: hypothetical protein SLRJCFUN_002301 [Candidatus Fervidibacter sp.]